MNPKFEMKAGETAAQYNARNNTSGLIEEKIKSDKVTSNTEAGTSSLLSRLEERLLGNAEGISSSSSEIENAITSAISAQEKGRAAGERRIQNDYNSEKSYMMGDNQAAFDTALEGRSGYGTQVAALRRLTETTDKNMRDLEVRRQDALLANDAQAATQIASLQMKQLEFKQEKEQQFYNNAFQLAGLDLQQKAQDRAKQEFTDRMAFDKEQRTFDRQDKMASLAAQAGVAYDATDTFETLSVKIAAIADEERRLKAQETLARIKGDSEAEDEIGQYSGQLLASITEGRTPEQAMTELGSWLEGMGGGFNSTKEFNAAYKEAQRLYDEYKKTKAFTEAETGGNFLSRFFSGNSTPTATQDKPMNMRGPQTDPRQVAIESYFTGAPIY